jgi:hypothetical protein
VLFMLASVAGGPKIASIKGPTLGPNRIFWRNNALEAGGIEPPSRDNPNGGLYMHSRFFNLDAGDENRHPSPASSRLSLVAWPTAEPGNQPAVLQPA